MKGINQMTTNLNTPTVENEINDEKQTTQTLPEAPSVVFTQIYGKNAEGQTVQFNITVRANTIQEAIDEIMEGIKYGGEKYKLTTSRPDLKQAPPQKQPKPNTETAQYPQNTTNTTPAQSAPIPPTSQATNHTNTSTQNIIAVRMEVTPRSDGKVKLNWYELNHRYPDIYAVLTIERAIEMLIPTGQWELSHFEKVSTYNVNHKILWRESENKNSNGKPYKNIVSITPA